MEEQRSIESYLEELRHINEEMTQENIRMNEALKLYEKGVSLVREAEKMLEQYQQQIEIIETAD
ncbi:MAG: exodeoxyribonuclease VII small subunit [Clostridia bacterium]|nr:exodeoxyribonuclease VII small subunit [Clostridia bacterium]